MMKQILLNTKLKLIIDHVLIQISVQIWVYLDLKQLTNKKQYFTKFLYFFVLNSSLDFFFENMYYINNSGDEENNTVVGDIDIVCDKIEIK